MRSDWIARSRAAILRLAGLTSRSHDEHCVDEEMQFHLAALTELHERSGLSHPEAVRLARLNFGGIERHREAARDELRSGFVDRLWQDLRYGVRILIRTPVLTAAAVGTLALGIGATAALFGLLDRALFRSLRVQHPEQLYAVTQTSKGEQHESIPYPLFQLLSNGSPTSGTSPVAGYAFRVSRLSDGTDSVVVQLTSASWFKVLGVRPRIGRTWAEPSSSETTLQYALISDRLWHERFAGSASAIGASLSLARGNLVVVGVMPAGFTGISLDYPVDVWVPIEAQPTFDGKSNLADGGTNWVRPLLRIGPPGSLAAEQARVAVVGSRWRSSAPAIVDSTERLALVPASHPDMRDRGKIAQALFLVTALVSLVLLIACANIANLQLARVFGRRRELTIRMAVGAGRMRLIRQLLTESLLLAGASGAVGLWLAYGIGRLFTAMAATGGVGRSLTPSLADIADGHVLAFTAGLSLLSAVAFGLAPALQSTRLDLSSALRQTDIGAGGESGRRLRIGLVVAQLALSIVLLSTAGMVSISLGRAQSLVLGFDPQDLSQATFDLRNMPDPVERASLTAIADALRRMPGVINASVSLPQLYGRSTVSSSAYHVANDPSDAAHSIEVSGVSPEYFATARITVLRGRAFGGTDRDGAPLVTILNESAARMLFPGRDPVGIHFELMGLRHYVTVVGVVNDTRLHSVLDSPPPVAYIPLWQAPMGIAPGTTGVEVRTAAGADATSLVARATASVNSGLRPVVQSVSSGIGDSLALDAVRAWATGALGLVGFLLAVFGVYGLHSYLVARRTSELGLRLALGASPAQVRWLIWRQGMRPVVAGALIGIAVAAASTRLTAAAGVGHSTSDVWIIAATTLLLIGVAGVACYVPARRGSRLSPAVALRGD